VIGSQAPLHPDYHGPDTCGDFWRAVFENRVGTIVALAAVQRGFSGSARYFPTAAAPVSVHGEFTVRLVEERELSPDIALRTLDVTRAGDAAAAPGAGAAADGSEDTLRVAHLHYQSFPNYGVPKVPDGLRLLIRKVEQVGSLAIGCLRSTRSVR
jgi:hypothetical protein